MGEYWNEDYDDDNAEASQGDGPGDLRKAHRASVKENKALKQQIEDLNTQLAGLSGQVRTRSLSELLQAKGVAPKVAQFYPKDVEVDEDAVTQWIEANKDVFNIKVADSGTPSNESASQDQDEQPVQDAGGFDLSALQAALGASSGGSPVPAGQAAALLNDIDGNAKSFEDVVELMNKHGIETKTGY